MTSVAKFLVFKHTILKISSHTQSYPFQSWTESKSLLVGHCCLPIWILTTQPEHEINPSSCIKFGPFQWATTLSRTTNCGSDHTMCCNQGKFLSQAESVALQKNPTNLSPLFCYCLRFFFTAPHKIYTTFSQSQSISTICFEAAVYNNPTPCHNPFKGTKKKTVLPEDYFSKV